MKAAELREFLADLSRSTAELTRSTAELRASQLETNRQKKDADRQIMEHRLQMKETDRLMKDTDRQMKDTDEKIKALSGLFTSQWGKLVEALMRPGTVKLFQERGLQVNQMTERRTGRDSQGEKIEVDMTLVNGNTIVVIEVKTTLKVEDVLWHLDKLGRFKEAFKEYAGWNVQGGLAAMHFDEESDRYAFRKGLWVLRCEDGITGIANAKNFQPKNF